MVSKILFALERGGRRILKNTKLLFLASMLFIFPLLFILVLEGYSQTATTNVATAEKQRVGVIHDSLVALAKIDTALMPTVFVDLVEKNSDIKQMILFKVLEEEDGVLETVHSLNAEDVGSTSTLSLAFQFGTLSEEETTTIPLRKGSSRIDHVITYVSIDTTKYYLFTEHDRTSLYEVLGQRKQNAYLLLSLLFAFMIGLAYWINKQTDWEHKYTKLEDTLKERDLFSNMIAHEFRTPLTAIKGYASFLQESKTLTSEEARFADIIGESAQRLVLLVNDFLEVARIQSGRMKIESAEVDVRELIKEVFTSLQAKAAQKKLQLVYTPSLKAQLLTTDRNRFIQVLTNIISNSIKYTDEGTVEISCEEDRAGITLRVKDTGMGITATDQQKLFAPFSRVGDVDKTTTTGTGLGMWITKQMIELLDGTIAVESIKAVGTHVVMTFKRTK